MLAYTTIMALGILTMFLGGNNTAFHDRRDHVSAGPRPLQGRLVFGGGQLSTIRPAPVVATNWADSGGPCR
jgi:hypothetical protein